MRNWAGNVTYEAAQVAHPTSVQDLQQLVAASRKIRALGTGHSFSHLADTTGTLVSLGRMPEVLEIDSAARTVRVAAGLRYGDIGGALREAGLALPNLASLPHISIAGCVATGTHGSGTGNQVLAGSVRSLTLMTADGDLITLDRESHRGDFDGCVVALGRLGVVVDLVLDLVPDFEVAQTVVEDVDETALAEDLPAAMASAYSVSIFTDWAARGAPQVWLKERVGDEAERTHDWGGRPADGPRHPIDGMPTEHATVQLGQAGPWNERLPHFRLDFMPSSGDELQSEYFVAARHAGHAWKAISGLRDTVAPVLQISEVRAIAADPFWLSPTRGEPTIAFHFTWVPDADAVRPAVAAVESELAAFEARPHWGKLFQAGPDRLAELYSRMADFRGLVARLDPGAKLGNALVDGWLGLS